MEKAWRELCEIRHSLASTITMQHLTKDSNDMQLPAPYKRLKRHKTTSTLQKTQTTYNYQHLTKDSNDIQLPAPYKRLKRHTTTSTLQETQTRYNYQHLTKDSSYKDSKDIQLLYQHHTKDSFTTSKKQTKTH